MPRSGLLDGICGKKADCIDTSVLKGLRVRHFLALLQVKLIRETDLAFSLYQGAYYDKKIDAA
jgi:hypothetical protein